MKYNILGQSFISDFISLDRKINLVIFYSLLIIWSFKSDSAFGFTHNYQKRWRTASPLFLTKEGKQKDDLRVFVMGKIIIDEYGSPEDILQQDVTEPNVGGGGPQAAWGAAAALSVLRRSTTPQAVTFMGPVGSVDWTGREENSLQSILRNVLDAPYILWKHPEYVTPRIRLWHDEQEQIQWFPLNDSFGEKSGARALWSSTPTFNDFKDSILQYESLSKLRNEKTEDMVCNVIHVIMEGGRDSPSQDWETELLLKLSSYMSEGDESLLMSKHFILSLEPVVFPDPATGKIRKEDAQHCYQQLEKISASFSKFSNGSICISPDYPLYQSLCEFDLWDRFSPSIHSWAVRNGSEGSEIHFYSGDKKVRQNIKAGTLQTVDGKPVDPTGAGNAFASAYAAILGSGKNPIDAACVATGVGAVFCEHKHVPPYTDTVIERIQDVSRFLQDHYNEKEIKSI